jgi:BolA protein
MTDIHALLTAAFAPVHMHIADRSGAHIDHPESLVHGGAHLYLTLVSQKFEGQNPVARHRLVYNALGEAFADNTLHALSLKLFTPAEWQAQNP